MKSPSYTEIRIGTQIQAIETLIHEMSKPIDWETEYQNYIEKRQYHGVSGITFNFDIWADSEKKIREKTRKEYQEYLDNIYAEKAKQDLEELCDDYDHYSIRHCGGPTSPLGIFIYKRNNQSPTRCNLYSSYPDSNAVRKVVGAAVNDYVGPRRGEMAGI